MKTILYFLLMGISALAYGQPDVLWETNLGGSDNEFSSANIATTDGGVVIAGRSSSSDGDVTNNQGNSDVWVVKLDAQGEIDWQYSYGGSDFEFCQAIAQTSDGGFIIGGSSASNDGDISGNNGGKDGVLLKLDSDGNLEWQQSYGGSLSEDINAVQQTSDGGYIFAATTTSSDGDVTENAGEIDFWIVKTNAIGTVEWQQTYGGSENEYPYSIKETSEGGFIVAGNTASDDGDITFNHGERDIWVLKLSETGTLEWQQTYGGTADDQSLSLLITPDEGYILAGYSDSNNGDVGGNFGDFDFWVLRLSDDGTILWEQNYGGSDEDRVASIIALPNGNYAISGLSFSNDGSVSGNNGERDFWVLEIDSEGALQWQESYGGSGIDVATDIVLTSDNGIVISGSSNSTDGDISNNLGGHDFWVLKLEGILNVADYVAEALFIYPNPADTFITFNTDKIVKATIYNALGEIVQAPVIFENGIIDISRLSSGWYIVEVKDSSGQKKYLKFLKR
ncbi:T9SS type A sorting domain-containing protein [Flavobacteriaceae bacterium TK19130]|nr:T9SS type A sorting domain-containing protein [Thermobacterium salinum]